MKFTLTINGPSGSAVREIDVDAPGEYNAILKCDGSESVHIVEPKTYRSGLRYHYKYGGDYILAQVSAYTYALISLDDGNRYNDPPVSVKSYLSGISAEDFGRMCAGRPEDFTPIKKVTK